jgi:hypothetical protein
MLKAVLRGHKTLSLTAGLREDQKLRTLENRVKGDVLFEHKARKHIEIGEKLHNEHLYNMSSLLNIIWIIK